MECSLKGCRTSLGAGFYPPGGTVKSQGQRSLQIVALGSSASGAPMDIRNPIDRMVTEEAGKVREGLGKGEYRLLGKKPWWAPIFKFGEGNDLQSGASGRAAATNGRARRATVFTEEKARALRRELRETESWHDLMYHSAIASRLAVSDHDSA